ncbi:MAG: PIN domain-containing protein [Bdellovibrionales bacterium]
MPSIALDTNVLLRLFVDDDSYQHKLAVSYAEEHFTIDDPGFVSVIAVCEYVWVLRAVFDFKKSNIIKYLDVMFRTRCLSFENKNVLENAFASYKNGSVDYADYVIKYTALGIGVQKIVTFDKKAGRDDAFLVLK